MRVKAKANTKGNKGVVAIGDGNDGTDTGGMGDSPLAVVKQKEAKLSKRKRISFCVVLLFLCCVCGSTEEKEEIHTQLFSFSLSELTFARTFL